MSNSIYFNDFNDSVGDEWNVSSLYTTPDGSESYLGRFNSQEVVMNLDSIESGQYIVNFEFWALITWDGFGNSGNGMFGPDIFEFSINSQSFLNETFSNSYNRNQSYPNGGSNPYCTGAELFNPYGHTDTNNTEDGFLCVYQMNFDYDHSGGDINLLFNANLTEGLYDESWGIDKVEVIQSIDGFTYSGTLGNSSYYISDNSAFWVDANQTCLDAGGHLVSISSQEENDFVHSLSSIGYWIGLRKLDGGFVWSSGEPFTYSNWDMIEGQPDGDGDFVQMYTIGTWNDHQDFSIRYVLELQPSIGDLNNDSIINVSDIVLLVELVLFISNGEEPTDEQLQLGDIYPDGQLNVVDIVGLVNIILDL